MPERIAIIAAIEREIAPLVEAHGFSRVITAGKHDGALAPGLKVFRSAETVVLVGGMGRNAAARAARAAIDLLHPTLLVSAGFAGSLTTELGVADILVPSSVIDAASGRPFSAEGHSEATLVTASSVLSRDAKFALAARFSADAADMEAAAVAEVAEKAGIRFAAVKAVSDPFDFEMPPLDRFLDSAGKLNLLQLLVYAALRPRLWGVLAQLGRNSARAAQTLAGALADLPAGRPALAR